MGGRVVRIVTRLNRGGPLRQLTALVPALAARGWTGPVVCGLPAAFETDGADDLRAGGARILRVKALRRGLDVARDARALRAVLGVLRHERPDLVHTHTGKAGALGRIAARIAGVPCVHTYHGHHFAAPWPRDVLAVRAERRLGRLTAAGIALTPRQRRDVVETYRVLPASRVELIPPGFDVQGWRTRAANGPAPWTPDGRVTFLWSGRFVPVKRPDLCVEAARASSGSWRLVMVGGGPLLRPTRRDVESAGLAQRIRLPGEVEDVAPWIAAADGLVLSSDSEGSPLAVLEAKALGRPAVATAVGGVPDLVEHLHDGLWVPPGDAPALAAALDRLAADPALLRRLGRQAADDVEGRYGADRLARDTADLYARMPRSRYHRRR